MRLIGKLDDFLVYEVDDGKYIIVSPESGKWKAEWTWYGQLGRWCDTFTKCSEDENDLKCVEIIEKNKEKVLEALNKLKDIEQDDIGEEYLKEQKEFYERLSDGMEYDWFKGDYSE